MPSFWSFLLLPDHGICFFFETDNPSLFFLKKQTLVHSSLFLYSSLMKRFPGKAFLNKKD